MDPRRLLIVFNICGISGRDNVGFYVNHINSLVNQDLDGCRVLVSSCMNPQSHKDTIAATFGDKISYCHVNEVLPINVTFNFAVMKAVEHFGKFEGYLYVDSGINFNEIRNGVHNLYKLFHEGPYAMVAARTDTDAGTFLWFGIGGHAGDESGQQQLFRDGHFVIPVGKAWNLHAQIFSNDILEAYGRLMPDIFASHCTESTFSFLCAAIKKKWVVHKDVVVEHRHGMDVGSAGFNPAHIGYPAWQHLFRSPRHIYDIIGDPEGTACGFGYEECQNIKMHDPAQFDENGFSRDDRLKEFIKKNLFLPVDRMDYNNIVHTFHP